MHEAVRESWSLAMNRECQVLIGDAACTRPLRLRSVFKRFAENLPQPQSRVEAALLRGRLLELCLRWGATHHRLYHLASGSGVDDCGLRTNDLAAHAWHDWSHPGPRAFELWADAYVRHFSRHHPLDAISELIDELNRNPVDNTILRRVAHDRGLTLRKLRADFQKQTGTSVRSYQTGRRVERAITLLKSTDEKVQTVANDVGWANRKDLIRAVRDATGFTPAQIRRSSRR
jgi:AraC-like DNA-binding protein